MKIKEGFLLRSLGDSTVVVPVGAAALDLRGMISLNETGAFLWEQLQEEQTPQSLCEALCDHYDVSSARAEEDVARFMTLLDQYGLLDV